MMNALLRFFFAFRAIEDGLFCGAEITVKEATYCPAGHCRYENPDICRPT